FSFMNEALRLTRALPGVSAATIADGLPLSTNRSWGISVGGEEYVKGRSRAVFVRMATDGFVDAMGMTLVAGRDLTPQDVTGKDPVVVINETGATTLWPGGSALGKLARVAGVDRRVVGIVRDVRHLSLEEGAGIEAYLPLEPNDYMSLTLIVRTKVEP